MNAGFWGNPPAVVIPPFPTAPYFQSHLLASKNILPGATTQLLAGSNVTDLNVGGWYNNNGLWLPPSGGVILWAIALITGGVSTESYTLTIVKNGVSLTPISQDVFKVGGGYMVARAMALDTSDGTGNYGLWVNNTSGITTITVNNNVANTAFGGWGL